MAGNGERKSNDPARQSPTKPDALVHFVQTQSELKKGGRKSKTEEAFLKSYRG